MLLSINIPDTVAVRVRDAFCSSYGYQDQIANPDFDPSQPESSTNPGMIANPESKAEFTKGQVIRYIKEVVKGYESQQAAEQARESAAEAADSDINLT